MHKRKLNSQYASGLIQDWADLVKVLRLLRYESATTNRHLHDLRVME